MLKNMNFYGFMHRQILIVIGLLAGTGIGYIYMGYLYGSLLPELIWYALVLGTSVWGYRLYRAYLNEEMSLAQKDAWLKKLRYFLFIYFSLWIIIFIIYVSSEHIEQHYIAVFTQIGVVVVSATILVSQKKLAVITLITSMLPITIYFLLLDQFYSYLLALFSVVLGGVLLYASRTTYNYLVKSKFQAYHDYLTKLGNRRYFIEVLDNAIKVHKNDNSYIYLLLIDLDHFKTINDTLGHDIGDVLLCEVSERMRLLAKKNNNTVARLGGDEFCVLSSSFPSHEACLESAMQFSEEIIKRIKETYIIEEHHLYISASVGVSLIHNSMMQANTFLKEADIAMYEAKAQGRDGVMLFNDELSLRIERKLKIERLLHFALEKKEISLRYQPQLDSSGKVIGCEVLVRWYNDTLGQVGPDEFIPISEKTGLIVELGHYILEESFKTLRDWDEKGLELEQLSINISMRQIFHNNFTDEVKKLISKYLNEELCSKLVFEMTETSMAEDVRTLIERMHSIKKFGIRFSMDDFGTGYSSLSYLRQIPIDELKIDRSFISELEDTLEDKNMVKTILSMAKNLGLCIVAEGVETKVQQTFLIEEDCDILQGYHFCQPVHKEEFETYVKEQGKV